MALTTQIIKTLGHGNRHVINAPGDLVQAKMILHWNTLNACIIPGLVWHRVLSAKDLVQLA